jgi:hypothetical protein
MLLEILKGVPKCLFTRRLEGVMPETTCNNGEFKKLPRYYGEVRTSRQVHSASFSKNGRSGFCVIVCVLEIPV